ncbi:unnamed protein product [Spirodela intermedia]|uniref:Uncharacterized protein n=1 Tax=Spirodela intermedia TaxID=51605 RepID=A0A7I8L5H7_SPIIN|nr:unnamed protein product [Spirodela intermedia]
MGSKIYPWSRWGGAAAASPAVISLMPAAILAMTAALGADDREGLGRLVERGGGAATVGAPTATPSARYAALWRESRRRSRRRWGSPGRRRTAPPQPPEPAWRGRRRAGGAAAAWSLWRSYGRSEYCDRTQPSPIFPLFLGGGI